MEPLQYDTKSIKIIDEIIDSIKQVNELRKKLRESLMEEGFSETEAYDLELELYNRIIYEKPVE